MNNNRKQCAKCYDFFVNVNVNVHLFCFFPLQCVDWGKSFSTFTEVLHGYEGPERTDRSSVWPRLPVLYRFGTGHAARVAVHRFSDVVPVILFRRSPVLFISLIKREKIEQHDLGTVLGLLTGTLIPKAPSAWLICWLIILHQNGEQPFSFLILGWISSIYNRKRSNCNSKVPNIGEKIWMEGFLQKENHTGVLGNGCL